MNIIWLNLLSLSDNNKHIFIYRLSAMGDVAMLVQTVWNVLTSNPDVKITLITRPFFHSFFGVHDRLNFFPLDLDGNHKGFSGLLKLAKEISNLKPTLFIDEHDVLRSKIVRSGLKLSRVKTIVFDKGRAEKQSMLLGQTVFRQLPHSIQRYNDAIEKAGLKIDPNYRFTLPTIAHEFRLNAKKKIIGFAPFSAHESKEWGLENVKSFLQLLESTGDYEVLLFGGGKQEERQIKELTFEFSNTKQIAGKFSIDEELAIMKSCEVFVAMDSSNMHLADLVGSQVISLWFSTHPNFGFYAWNNKENSIALSQTENNQIPLSIFGKLKTADDLQKVESIRKLITPEMVVQKIEALIN